MYLVLFAKTATFNAVRRSAVGSEMNATDSAFVVDETVVMIGVMPSGHDLVARWQCLCIRL